MFPGQLDYRVDAFVYGEPVRIKDKIVELGRSNVLTEERHDKPLVLAVTDGQDISGLRICYAVLAHYRLDACLLASRDADVDRAGVPAKDHASAET